MWGGEFAFDARKWCNNLFIWRMLLVTLPSDVLACVRMCTQDPVRHWWASKNPCWVSHAPETEIHHLCHNGENEHCKVLSASLAFSFGVVPKRIFFSYKNCWKINYIKELRRTGHYGQLLKQTGSMHGSTSVSGEDLLKLSSLFYKAFPSSRSLFFPTTALLKIASRLVAGRKCWEGHLQAAMHQHGSVTILEQLSYFFLNALKSCS